MTKTFPNTGADFSGLNGAERWLREHCHAYGSMQRGAPIGVHHEEEGQEVYISKWRGMTAQEKRGLDGQILPDADGFRNGSARVVMTGGPLA